MNASPTLPDPLQQQIDALALRTGSIEVRVAQVEVAQRQTADEVHGYLTNVAAMGQKHGKLEEKIDGLREQQRVQHAETRDQLTNLTEGLKPLTDAFQTKDQAREALKGLASREAFWRDVWHTAAREAVGWAVKGLIALLILGLLALLTEKLGLSHLTGAAAVSTATKEAL